jgi:hypothetical protein
MVSTPMRHSGTRVILIALLSALACGLAVWVAGFLTTPGAMGVFRNKEGKIVDEEGRITDEDPWQKRERIICNLMLVGAALGAVGGALMALCRGPWYGLLVGLLTGAAVGFNSVWWIEKKEPLAGAAFFAAVYGVCGAVIGAVTATTGPRGSGQEALRGRDAE